MDSSFRNSYAQARQALDEVLAQPDAPVDAASLGEQLWAIARLVDDNPALRRNLADLSREGGDKAELAQQLLTGKVGPATLLVVSATVAQRWTRPGDLVEALERLGVESTLTSAERHARLGQVEEQLFRFSRIVEANPELQAALSDRRAPAHSRSALVERLLSIKTAPETVALAQQSVSGSRGRRFDRAIQDFLEQAAQRQQQVTATVITAAPMAPHQLDRLTAALSAQYGRRVHANVVIDEQVVGGIRVEIGDEVIDGTISQRLADARRRLIS